MTTITPQCPRLTTALLIALLGLFSAQLRAAENPALELFATINHRLSYMEAVALYKAQNQMPIEDLVRERQVISDAQRTAESLGLNAESVSAFFAAQIAVAKAIQYRVRADLLSVSSTSTNTITKRTIDLNTEIRPALSALGDQIIAQLATVIASSGVIAAELREDFHASISVSHVSDADTQQLFNALLQIRAQ